MKKLLVVASLPAILLTTNIRANDSGPSIGLNFGADEVAGSFSAALATSDLAGAVPQANWNNLAGASGSASGLITDLFGQPIGSSVSVTWSSPNTWSTTAGGPNNGFPDGPDRTLMTGYLDTDEGTGVATVTVSGLGSDFTHGNYDVIVYVLGGGAGRGGAYTIGSTTLFGTSPANPTTHIEDPGVDLTDTGTCVVFRRLSGDSFTLTASANAASYPPNSVNFRAPINGIQIVSRASSSFNIFNPLNPIVLVNGVNDGDPDAGPPPAAETVDHAIDGVGQKYLNFLDLGSGFATTRIFGPTIAQAIRFYTANDAEERDPASYVLEGSTGDTSGPWTMIASGPLALPSDRNPGGSASLDPATAFNQLVAFANSVPYTSYRVTFPALKDAATANSMQIGEVELLGFPPNHCPTANPLRVSVSPGGSVTFQLPASDPDNDLALFLLHQAPAHGPVYVDNLDPTATYTPTPGYCGPDSFEYYAIDRQGCWSEPATVSITVGDTPPIVSCPADIIAVATSPAGSLVTYDLPTVTSPCTITSLICSPPSGSTFPIGTTTVVCTAMDVGGNSGTCRFNVTVQSPDPFITKSADKPTSKVGQTLVYTINVKNVGTASAAGVIVNDPIPQQATFLLASASQGTFTAPPVGAAGTVSWNVGNLAAGATASLILQVKVTAKGKDLIANTATVRSTTFDGNPDNNTATITTRRGK